MLVSKRLSPEDFLDYWQRNYAGTPLVGHLLKERFPGRWLRIHNLPEGKRYAETEDEYCEILSRQNRLFSDLIGEGGRCEIVYGYFGEENCLPKDVLTALSKLDPVFLVTIHQEDSGLVQDFPLLKASFEWKKGSLDIILRAIADDILETPLIICMATHCILAPYDGGVDVIVASEGIRDELVVRYTGWLSSDPSGL